MDDQREKYQQLLELCAKIAAGLESLQTEGEGIKVDILKVIDEEKQQVVKKYLQNLPN